MATSKRSVTTTIILIIIATIISTSTSDDIHPSCHRPYKNVGPYYYGPKGVPHFIKTPASYDLDCPTDYDEYPWLCGPLRPPTHESVFEMKFCRHSVILLHFTSIRYRNLVRGLEVIHIAQYNNTNTLYDFGMCKPTQSRRHSNLEAQLNDPNRGLDDVPVCTQFEAPCYRTFKFGFRDGATGFTDCTDDVKSLVAKYYRQYRFPPSWPAVAG